jgi:hypothetical protein
MVGPHATTAEAERNRESEARPFATAVACALGRFAPA